MLLTDSKDEDEDNLHFLQELRQMIALALQPTAKFAPLTIPRSLKLS
jgi:hypothetical protein